MGDDGLATIPGDYQYRALTSGPAFQRAWHREKLKLVDALVRAGNRAVMVVIGSDSPVVSKVGRLSEQVRRTVPAPVVVVGPDGPVDGDAETSLADLHSSR